MGKVRTGRCQRCGKPFEQHGRGHPQVYCSPSCRTMAWRDRNPGLTPTQAQEIGRGLSMIFAAFSGDKRARAALEAALRGEHE